MFLHYQNLNPKATRASSIELNQQNLNSLLSLFFGKLTKGKKILIQNYELLKESVDSFNLSAEHSHLI